MKTSLGPGEGFAFNGSTDWLVMSNDNATNAAGLPKRDFTVSAWISLKDTKGTSSIIGCFQDGAGAQGGWTLGYAEESFRFGLSGNATSSAKLTYIKSASKIQPDHWYHVVGTYDGRSMKLFVNGDAQGESKDQSGDIAYPAHAPFLAACAKDGDKAMAMNGNILEIKVLGRTLTPQQIVDEYTPGVRLSSFKPEMEATQRFVVKPYLQFVTLDGATIMWETSRPGKSIVEYGEQLPYTNRTSESSEGTLHEIRITGLKPETPYFYRVHTVEATGTEIVGEDLSFATAVLPGTPFAVAIIGDTQKNKPVIEKLQTFAFSLRPNMEIHLGDVVDKGADRGEWIEELLPASYPLISRVCLYPSIGNHEENHSNYYRYFSLPAPECWYTYTYGDAQFFVLDTNKDVSPGSEQYKWLEAELSKSKAIWKFAYHHHPVYSSDEDDYGDTYKGKSIYGDPRHRVLAALYEKYHVDIDFNGHIHSYERTWPIFEGKVDEDKGVRYVTCGGGGGGLESAGPNRSWFTQRVYRGHHMCIMTIHDKTLQFQAFDLEGRLFDQMDLHKK